MNVDEMKELIDKYFFDSDKQNKSSIWYNQLGSDLAIVPKTPTQQLFDLDAFGKRIVFISPHDTTTENLLTAIGVTVHVFYSNLKFFFLTEYEQKSKDKI